MKTGISLFAFALAFSLTYTNAQTLIKDIKPGTGNGILTVASFNLNGTFYFIGNTAEEGAELWKSDGSEAGTVLVKDINPGTAGTMTSDPYFGGGNGLLYFSPYVASTNYELWKTDGTSGGTAMVKDIYAGVGASSPTSYTNLGSKTIFEADDSLHGRELWVTDGTTGGTTMVKDILPGVNGSFSGVGNSYFKLMNGSVYFSGYDLTSGGELWKTDGTTAGTVMVKDIAPGNGTSRCSFRAVVNDMLFFAADDGIHGWELWKSDGSEAGTTMIKDINPGSNGSFPSSFSPAYIAVMGTTYYFQANDGAHGLELWKSDGTEGGTSMVKDIATGSANSYPFSFTPMNGKLYFAAGGTTSGNQLWKTDGTDAGTSMIQTSVPFDGAGPSSLISIGNTLYFVAGTIADGQQLWKSDGTDAGTKAISINPSDDAKPKNLTDVNGTLFFSATDGTHGVELWKYDGSATGLPSPLSGKQVKVYPNPASRKLFIDNYEGVAEIYNSQGLLVDRWDIKGSSEIDISQQPDGMYILKYVSGNASALERLVIMR